MGTLQVGEPPMGLRPSREGRMGEHLAAGLADLIARCRLAPPHTAEQRVFVDELLELQQAALGAPVSPQLIPGPGPAAAGGWARITRLLRPRNAVTQRLDHVRQERLLLRAYERLCELDLPLVVSSVLLRQHGFIKRRSYRTAPRPLGAS